MRSHCMMGKHPGAQSSFHTRCVPTISYAQRHSGVEGKHEPVLDEQHLKARVRAKHLEHGLDVLERSALDRPVTHTHTDT